MLFFDIYYMTKLEFLEKARNTHGYKYQYPDLSNKITLKDKITISLSGTTYYQNVSKHLLGRCPEKSTPKKTTEEFILESKKIWKDKYDYSLTEYTGALDSIKIIYNGIVYEQRASSHLSGLAPEFRNNEESLLREKIHQSDLIGTYEIKSFLNKYDYQFEEDKNLDNYIFQFYLPNIRTAIDFLGREHYLCRELDKIKQDYCEDNYINLIRIRYGQIDDIYQILWNNLKS